MSSAVRPKRLWKHSAEADHHSARELLPIAFSLESLIGFDRIPQVQKGRARREPGMR
jgi:hypothetical protein